MCHLSQGVTELLCITFSDRWDLLAVIWVLLCDCAAGTRGIIQQVVRNDLSGQQMEYQFPPVDVPYEFCGCFELTGSLALFILPILSMGLYAEERKRGTLGY